VAQRGLLKNALITKGKIKPRTINHFFFVLSLHREGVNKKKTGCALNTRSISSPLNLYKCIISFLSLFVCMCASQFVL